MKKIYPYWQDFNTIQ